MSLVLAGLAAFVVMEFVSYSVHRWLMHGVGMAWHRSHHAPPTEGWFERNDLFPVCFSAVGIALFALASFGRSPVTWGVAVGVTLYGACYFAVHELYIHRRAPVPLPRKAAYLDWVRDAHRDHHQTGGEPYGMLLPLFRSSPVAVANHGERDPLDRASTRKARARL